MNLKKRLLMLLGYSLLICCVFLTSCKQNNNTIDSDLTNTIDSDLIDYKEIMISEIISYRDSKIENSFYSESECVDINSISEISIGEIYKAEDKTTIDLIVFEAKRDMNLVKPKISETEFLQQFDLSDTKISFSNPGIDFYADRVVVVLKKSVQNPKISLENFCLNNGERIYVYNFGNYDNPNYRYILTIYLKEHGTEKVVEAVTELNKLEFVRVACPAYIYEIQDN